MATYNVLASAYVQRAWYRRTPVLVLDPAWRVPALVQYVAKLDADILCLQEVEPETFVALRTFLGERGYQAQYARKLAGRPDGCAILYRRQAFELLNIRSVPYSDGGGGTPDSGYIALFAEFQCSDGRLGVINTHLTWDSPGIHPPAQRGLRQVQQLIAEYESAAALARGWIIGGDLNASPASEIVSLLEQAGLQYAHRDFSGMCTCNVGANARMIDYLFYSPALVADPIKPPLSIDDSTILPSVEQPSDHVAILAKFSWHN